LTSIFSRDILKVQKVEVSLFYNVKGKTVERRRRKAIGPKYKNGSQLSLRN